jgi:hypothetical protein
MAMDFRASVRISDFSENPPFSHRFCRVLGLKAVESERTTGSQCSDSNRHGLIAAYHTVSVTGPAWKRGLRDIRAPGRVARGWAKGRLAEDLASLV